VDAPRVTALRLREILAPACRAHGLDLCGAVGLPRRLPHAAAWFDWLQEGKHGDLGYLRRAPHDRADPTRERPWARTLLVFGQRYAAGWPARDEPSDGAWTLGVARYARGLDYHDVLRGAIRRTTDVLRHDLHRTGVIAAEADLRAADFVDAGPFLEREHAWLAGLGFFGKNTLLIHPRLGSGLFLGVAVLGLEVTGLADAPRPLVGPPAQRLPDSDGMASLCGNCSLCQDHCPTGALDTPYVLDARRCLATWSIEWQGRAPAALRAWQGDHLFGCDICQQVCPWNHKALRRPAGEPPRAEYEDLPEHADLDLGDLIRMDAATFRARFRRTPLWRAHPEGMRRNALIVAANTGRRDLLPAIREAAAGDPDTEVREVAAWALAELEEAPS
jgi:epoxyqueuosine reductase